MKNKKDKKARILLIISRILVYAFLIFLAALCIFFFYLMVINSTRNKTEIQTGFTLIPRKFFWQNLQNAWKDGETNIPIGMKNSLIIGLSCAVLTSYFSALTAYAIHCYEFKYKKLIFGFILAVMMIPSQVGTVGFVQLVFKYHLTNRLWVLIIPSIAAPGVFFYMKQYLEATLPLEMVEAARMDGSSEFRIFNEIVLPIMKPAISVQMIFSFISSWNNYFLPNLVLNKPAKKTVPVLIATLRSMDYAKFDMGKVYMLMVLAILPVIIVYLLLSKSIIKGVTSGSVKG